MPNKEIEQTAGFAVRSSSPARWADERSAPGEKMTSAMTTARTASTGLVRLGGIAGLAAGLLFRRNIAAEISLFSSRKTPVDAKGWFELLQENAVLGLSQLNVLDIVNCVLLGLMFLALYAVLVGFGRRQMLTALVCAWLGSVVYMVSSPALPLLVLSARYATAPLSRQAALLAGGETILSYGRFTMEGARSGVGGYASLLFVAIATVIASAVMWRSRLFGRITPIVGLLAGALDLTYCLIYVTVSSIDTALLALTFIPAAGLLIMLWHVMVGWRLLRMASHRPTSASS